jgi:2-amino-4-hydroxy-6-hydroxymethyldihydropteridine diphosphokinase
LKPDDLQYMNKAYLLIGGNMGDRLQNLGRSVELLKGLGNVKALSGLYETAAWGKTDQPAFLNQAIFLETELTARELLQAVLDIEETMGRRREVKFGPRIIDIDLLFYNRDIIDEPGLSIPHPEVQNRRFALEPLHEIAPKLLHPVFGKSVEELLWECEDKLEVKKLEIRS